MTNPYQGPDDEPRSDDDVESERSSGRNYRKLLLLLTVAAAAAILLLKFGHYVQIDFLATKEAQLRAYQQQHPVLIYGIAFLVYVVVTGLSLPGAAALTLVYAWYFGWIPSLVVVSFASTAGATIAFMTSRYLLRESVESRFGSRLESFNHHLEVQGAFYLFTLRLIPLVPFFVINLVMGLTPLKTRTYWWVSQVGMLPGTMVYTYAGSSVPNLTELSEQGVRAVFSASQLIQLGGAFALLGIFPLATRLLLSAFSNARSVDSFEQPREEN